MNDACSLMQKRMEEKYLPALVNDCQVLKETIWEQEVSGNTGTIFELDLGRFTQEELVAAFEMVVALYHVNDFRERLRKDSFRY